MDVAARQADLSGGQPEYTYKGISRLDYVLCNRAAAVSFQSLEVDPAEYTDHAILKAEFDWSSSLGSRMTWRMPTDFATFSDVLPFGKDAPVCADLVTQLHAAIRDQDPDFALQFFVDGLEAKVANIYGTRSGLALPKAAFGRCCGKLVPVPSNMVVCDKQSDAATDRITLRQRIRTIQQCREI